LKLVGVARASLEELLLDYEDFLRQRGLPLWGKNQPTAQMVRRLAFEKNRTYKTYQSYIESAPETAANTVICLIHQTNYLLDQQLRQLEQAFLRDGGFNGALVLGKKEETIAFNRSYWSYRFYFFGVKR